MRKPCSGWRGRGLVLAGHFVLAVVAAACGDDPAPAPEADDPSAPKVVATDRLEPSSLPAPALPPPPPTPHNELRFQDAGRAPMQALAVPVVVGVPSPLVVTVSVRDRSVHRWRSPPRVFVDLSTAVQSILSDGSKTRTIDVERIVVDADDDEEKAVAKALAGHVETLLSRGGGASVDRYEVASVTGLEPVQGDLAPARTLAAAVAHGLSHLSLSVPPEPVGTGAKWTITRRVSFFGIPGWQTLACTLAAVDGHQVEITATVDYVLEAASTHDLPIDLRELEGGEVRGSLHTRFDRTAATPIEMRLKGKAKLRGGGAKSGTSRTVTFDIRVDEDYMRHPDPRVQLRGALTQGGLVHGVVPKDSTVWFNKRRVRLSDQGDFLLAFERNFGPRALLSFRLPDEPPQRHVIHIEPRDFAAWVVEAEGPSGEDEDAEARPSPGLDREAKRALVQARRRIKKVRSQVSDHTYFRAGFRLPLQGKVTAPFGVQQIVDGRDEGIHWGVDIDAPVGRKIRAPAGGVVVFAQADLPLSGSTLVLDHGQGLTSTFLHMHKFAVQEGDVVRPGQVLGRSGRSGHVRSPHLDWRMSLLETHIDPLLVLNLDGS